MFNFNQKTTGGCPNNETPSLKSRLAGADALSALKHAEVAELVEKDKMMEAVLLYRTLHGASFEEARDLVENIRLRLG